MAEPKKVVDEDEDYIFRQFEAFASGASAGWLTA